MKKKCLVCKKVRFHQFLSLKKCGACYSKYWRSTSKGRTYVNSYSKQYRKKNPEKVMSYIKNWQSTKAGRLSLRLSAKRWRYKYPELFKASNKRCNDIWKRTRRGHKMLLEGGRRYSKTEKGRLTRHKVMMKRRGVLGSHTSDAWLILLRATSGVCLKCRKRVGFKKMTRDHIIPISKGGTDNIENIQPLCRRCNSKKGVTTSEV